MKRIISFFLSIILSLSLVATTAFAMDVGGPKNPELENFSIDVSIADLKNGITVVVEKNSNGQYLVRQLSPEEIVRIENGQSDVSVEATFHCGLTYDSSNHTGYLHWNATGYQLTRVQAKVYCKSTSLLFPTSYFNGDIDGYSDLNGRYNSASGATDSFSIPSDVKKVNVGWSSASVTTVQNGKMSCPATYQTISLPN